MIAFLDLIARESDVTMETASSAAEPRWQTASFPLLLLIPLIFSLSLFPRQPGVDSYRKSTDLQDPYCKLHVTATQSQHSALCESVYSRSISGMKADLFRKPEGGDAITCDAADSHVVV